MYHSARDWEKFHYSQSGLIKSRQFVRSTTGLRPSKLFTYTNLFLRSPVDDKLLLCWDLNEVHLPANVGMTSV